MTVIPIHPHERPRDGGRPRRWTREEVYRLLNMGFFHPEERLEGIPGEIIQKAKHSPRHSVGITHTAHALRKTFTDGWYIAQQAPVVVAEDGKPEPDVSLVRGTPDDYREDHPTTADVILVVEVSDYTLDYDQGRKAAYYAEAGIADYWIVNLVDWCLEVHRNPVPAPDTTFGFAYGSREKFREGESVAPLAVPLESIAISDLLPQRQ